MSITATSSESSGKHQLPSKLQELCHEIREQPDEKTRLLKLASIGDRLSPTSTQQKNQFSNSSRVKGCTSITHLEVERTNDGVKLDGYSDSKFARGLIALVVLGMNGLDVQTIISISSNDILSACQLHTTSSVQHNSPRHNGLPSILKTLHSSLAEETENENTISPILKGSWKYINSTSSSLLLSSPYSSPSSVVVPDEEDDREIAVLLSGGVDSSVALHLAKQYNRPLRAYYLKIWLDDESSHLGMECPWTEDITYANTVCKQLNIPFEQLSLQKQYHDTVVSYTISESRKGRTPNPDIMCNTHIKFGSFFNAVNPESISYVVTGHYAKRTNNAHTLDAELRLCNDRVKDQTYFLSHLKQEQVRKSLFPLGDLNDDKDYVRKIAKDIGLCNHNRKDSQGICFLGKLKFEDFLNLHMGNEEGLLIEYESGICLGKHNGFWYYTIGQRKGIKLSHGPWYVVAKDVHQNIVYVSKDYESNDKERNHFDFDNVVWIAGHWPGQLTHVGQSSEFRVKIRHGINIHECVVKRLGDDKGSVKLKERDKGIAVGQFCAFYDYEDRCLGSGVISDELSLKGAPANIITLDRPVRLA